MNPRSVLFTICFSIPSLFLQAQSETICSTKRGIKTCITTNQSGDTTKISRYKKDLLHGEQWQRNYYETKISHYKKGEKHGIQYAQDKEGHLKYRVSFLNDLKNGKHSTFHRNGSLSKEKNFKAGELIGPTKHLYDNGQMERWFEMGTEYPYSDGWCESWKRNGDRDKVLYGDNKSRTIHAINYSELSEQPTSLKINYLLEFQLFENNKIKEIQFLSNNNYPLLSFSYYLSGQLRSIGVPDTAFFHFVKFYFAPDQSYLGCSSNPRRVSVEEVLSIAQFYGWNRPSAIGLEQWLRSFSKRPKKSKGQLTLKNSQGIPFFNTSLKNGLSHGKSWLINPTTKDTIMSRFFQSGFRVEWNKDSISPQLVSQKYFNSSHEEVQDYFFNGELKPHKIENVNGEIIQTEYYPNGHIKWIKNKSTKEVQSFSEQGFLTYESLLLEPESVIHQQISYFDNSDKKVKRINYSLNGRNHGEFLSFNETGDTLIRCNYRHGEKNGPCFSYNPNLGVKKWGNYIDDKKSGIWYFSTQGKMDSVQYFNGVIQSKSKSDLPPVMKEDQTLHKLTYYLNFTQLEEALPSGLTFSAEFDFKQQFLGTYIRENGNNGSYSGPLYSFSPVAFYASNDKNLRFHLNPSYNTPLGTQTKMWYSKNGIKKQLEIDVLTKTIQLIFEGGPLIGNRFDLNTQGIKYTHPKSLSVYLNEGFESDQIIPAISIHHWLNFSSIRVVGGYIQANADTLFPSAITSFLSPQQTNSFSGVKTTNIDVEFSIEESGKFQTIKGSAKDWFFGSHFATGILQLDGVQKKGNRYHLNTKLALTQAQITQLFDNHGFDIKSWNFESKKQTLQLIVYVD